jgi:hypothetical protein
MCMRIVVSGQNGCDRSCAVVVSTITVLSLACSGCSHTRQRYSDCNITHQKHTFHYKLAPCYSCQVLLLCSGRNSSKQLCRTHAYGTITCTRTVVHCIVYMNIRQDALLCPTAVTTAVPLCILCEHMHTYVYYIQCSTTMHTA